MENKNIRLEIIQKSYPFKVPEGYFENFTTEIMSQLPKHPVEKSNVISLWSRVKPLAYVAAMIAGIALVINLFVSAPNNRPKLAGNYATEGLKLNSPNDIDDFYRYYEDKMASVVFEDKMADFQDEEE